MPANDTPRMRIHQIAEAPGISQDVVVSIPDLVRWLRHVQVHVYCANSFRRERETVEAIADVFADHLSQIHADLENGNGFGSRTYISEHHVPP